MDLYSDRASFDSDDVPSDLRVTQLRPPPRDPIAEALAVTIANVTELTALGRRLAAREELGTKQPIARMLLRQLVGVPRWRRSLVKRVWRKRADVLAICDAGGVPAYYNDVRELRPLPRRGANYRAVRSLLDSIALADGRVCVLAFDARDKDPILVRLPGEA